ncbi:MAG: serine/threonine-protein phosphatase [Bdellovibrionales bacterium]|nr:serine/threonine-protein phosphatase [Bdellovibrionales bacterium]
MGVSAQSSRKINIDMEKPEIFELSSFELTLFTSKGEKAKGKNNEDACGFLSPSPSQVALVVSDGLGGHKMGDLASKITVNTILGRASQRRRPFKSAQIIEKVEKAHQKIMDLNSDAGATVVAAVIEGDSLWFYSVGDSLGYLFSESGDVVYKTFEHSIVGFATESGIMGEEEAQQHQDSNVILNSLGFYDSRLECSLRLKMTLGETILLCSDGLTDIMTLEEMKSCIAGKGLEEASEALVVKARELQEKHEHRDDLTIVLCRKKNQSKNQSPK